MAYECINSDYTQEMRANVYRCEGAWFAARFVDGALDCVDELEADTEPEAFAEAALLAEHVEVRRVADVDRNGNEVAS